MEKVRFGIIGIGNMGSAHAGYILALPNAALGAVCDGNPEMFKRLPAGAADAQRFTDDAEFFRDADIDAVIIATPHYQHPDLAIRALERGWHIVVEKPVAVHKAEAMRLLAAADRFPQLVKAVMFNQRTIPAHRRIKELIDHGELGELRRVNWIITDWFRTQQYYDSGDWRATWAGEGGGVLINQCPHQLDLLQWFAGMPSKVRAIAALGKYHDIEVEDDVTALLEYPNGATGVFIASTGEAPGTNRLEIVGDRGRLTFENGVIEFLRNEMPMDEFSATSKTGFDKPAVWHATIPYDPPPMPQHQEILANVVAAILHDAPLLAPMEEGVRGLELGNAMLLSGLTNAEVTLPIDEKAFADRLAALAAASRYRKKHVATNAVSADEFNKSH